MQWGGPPRWLLPQGQRRLKTDGGAVVIQIRATVLDLWQGGFEMMDKLMTHLERHFTLSHYDERCVTHTRARSRAPLRRVSHAVLYQHPDKG